MELPRTSPKKFVFVLMPFDEGFDDVYKVGIKLACRDTGAYCERVDEQIFHESILDQIYNQIAKADLIIADMTGRNPNVFYEVGYAHALNKRVILLTQNADDIPFDLKHYPHIVYGGSVSDLKDALERRLAVSLDDSLDAGAYGGGIQFFINGQELCDSCVIDIVLEPKIEDTKLSVWSEIDDSERHWLDVHQATRVKIQYHNRTNRIIELQDCQFLLFHERSVSFATDAQSLLSAPLPTGESLTRINGPERIFPGDWVDLNYYIEVEFDYLKQRGQKAVLKSVSGSGLIEIPFQFRLCLDSEKLAQLISEQPEASKSDRILRLEALWGEA